MKIVANASSRQATECKAGYIVNASIGHEGVSKGVRNAQVLLLLEFSVFPQTVFWGVARDDAGAMYLLTDLVRKEDGTFHASCILSYRLSTGTPYLDLGQNDMVRNLIHRYVYELQLLESFSFEW